MLWGQNFKFAENYSFKMVLFIVWVLKIGIKILKELLLKFVSKKKEEKGKLSFCHNLESKIGANLTTSLVL